MNLRPLGLVAGKADFGLRQLVEYLLSGSVCLMAIGTCDAAGFMLAARPVRAGKNARLMAGQARCVSHLSRRQFLRLGSEHDIRRLVSRIVLVFRASAMAGLAAWGSLIGLHAMFGLIDRENRRSPIFVVADSTILIPLKGPIHGCDRFLCLLGSLASSLVGRQRTGEQQRGDRTTDGPRELHLRLSRSNSFPLVLVRSFFGAFFEDDQSHAARDFLRKWVRLRLNTTSRDRQSVWFCSYSGCNPMAASRRPLQTPAFVRTGDLARVLKELL